MPLQLGAFILRDSKRISKKILLVIDGLEDDKV